MSCIFLKNEKETRHLKHRSFLVYWESRDLETTNFKMIRFVLLI